MKLPKNNLRELKKQKDQIIRERLEFIDKYVDHIKKTTNNEWSSAQKELINSQLRSLRKFYKKIGIGPTRI